MLRFCFPLLFPRLQLVNVILKNVTLACPLSRSPVVATRCVEGYLTYLMSKYPHAGEGIHCRLRFELSGKDVTSMLLLDGQQYC